RLKALIWRNERARLEELYAELASRNAVELGFDVLAGAAGVGRLRREPALHLPAHRFGALSGCEREADAQRGTKNEFPNGHAISLVNRTMETILRCPSTMVEIKKRAKGVTGCFPNPFAAATPCWRAWRRQSCVR